MNPAMERFLGRAKSDVIGTHSSTVIAPDDRERSRVEFAELLLRGEVQVDARRFVRPDGSVVTGDISATAVDVEGGLILGIMRDVTERNRAAGDARLLESVTLAASEAPNLVSAFEVVLRKICETNGWIFGTAWVPRPERRVLECACFWTRDPAARPIFQALATHSFAPGDGLPGRAWSSMGPLWVRDLATASCTRSATAGELGVHAGFAVPVVSKGKLIAVIEFFMDHVHEEEERFVRLVSASCERLASIMARKGAEDALRASEARFARLSESGIIGILSGDLSGNVVEANDAYLRMVGYSREDLLGGSIRWTDLTPPELKELAGSVVAQLADRGVVPAFEIESFRKDGTRVPMLLGIAVMDYPNIIAFAADLTERKRAEKALLKSEGQLRQAQKMEAVGRLAGGVAHDFNNLLSVILSYGELLLSELGPKDPMRADVEQIREAGMRAADLTRQLLMFSRQQVVEPKVLDVGVLLAGMDKMLRRILGEDVELVVRSVPGRILADPSSIEQIVMNLVVNARDAMPTGGKLTIETVDVHLDESAAREHPGVKPGPHVMLAVSDNGVGMDRETQSRIFEPFFTTKTKDKGTGLGLSTVFGIVQQSAGAISLYSEPGRGTSFKVFLPRVDAELTEEAPPEGDVNARGTETILLVEDEDQVRTVAGSILRRHGYVVLEAQNAGEALLICGDHASNIHLLLTDVVMPQMSGPELARRLADTRPDTRVLCMSGYTDDSIVRHGVLQAEIAYLQKPLTPRSLTRKVREVLDAPATARTTGALRRVTRLSPATECKER
jgi:PAS domain S-box-containing protein